MALRALSLAEAAERLQMTYGRNHDTQDRGGPDIRRRQWWAGQIEAMTPGQVAGADEAR